MNKIFTILNKNFTFFSSQYSSHLFSSFIDFCGAFSRASFTRLGKWLRAFPPAALGGGGAERGGEGDSSRRLDQAQACALYTEQYGEGEGGDVDRLVVPLAKSHVPLPFVCLVCFLCHLSHFLESYNKCFYRLIFSRPFLRFFFSEFRLSFPARLSDSRSFFCPEIRFSDPLCFPSQICLVINIRIYRQYGFIVSNCHVRKLQKYLLHTICLLTIDYNQPL
jgi:hypothetical protein